MIGVCDRELLIEGRTFGPREPVPARRDASTVNAGRHTTTGKIDVVAQLPTTLSHASAMVLHGQIYVAGGYENNTQLTDHVLRYDPTSRTATVVGHLPAPISDAAEQ